MSKKFIIFKPFPNNSKNEIFHCSNLLGRDVISQNILEQLEKFPILVSRLHQFAHVYSVIKFKSDRLTRKHQLQFEDPFCRRKIE